MKRPLLVVAALATAVLPILVHAAEEDFAPLCNGKHLPEGRANSGFIFHCHVEPNKVCGYQLEIELNGVLITEYTDDTGAKGHPGIQHHGEKGQTYRFRNLTIKPL
jgi:hypothetical protein